MEMSRHRPHELEALRAFTVPTLANALETFGLDPISGFCDSTMHCRFPELGLLLGYAVTARVSTDRPATPIRPVVAEADYWRFVMAQPGPKVAVVQDIDRPARGAMWGEWNANVHRALGCQGMITDGAARDLDGARRLGFHFFSTEILPSHGNGAFIDYGGSVRVAGLTVATGDLLAADQHGVLRIPDEISLPDLARACAEIDRLESEVFALCQASDFSLERLVELDASVSARWPRPA